jgi:hypothetical protein
MPPASSASRKRKPKGVNILDLVPTRNPQLHYSVRKEPFEKATSKDPGAAGTVNIMVPRFRGGLGQDFCRILRVSPWINVNLDAYGSHVWLRMDGHRTVRELGEGLKTHFGDTVEPIYGRLAEFLSLLERNRIIGYANIPRTVSKKAPSFS